MVFTIPGHGLLHATAQVVLRMVAQLVAGWLDVAAPVALFQNVVLVAVQRAHASRGPSCVFPAEGDGAEHPQGGLDAHPPRATQRPVQLVAESGTLVDIAVGNEVFASRHAPVQGHEYGLNQVPDVDKGDVLTLETHTEVHVLLDAPRN